MKKVVEIIILLLPVVLIVAILIFSNVREGGFLSGKAVSESAKEAVEKEQAAPTCDDGIWNQDESDMDCGGSCSTACPSTGVYTACWEDSDCQSAKCDLSQAKILPEDYTIETIRKLAGQSWIIPHQGKCE